jgi:hypothetical protein
VNEIDERSMVLPSEDCERLRHPRSWRQVSVHGDRVECCELCTTAVREALQAGLSPELADAFVRHLRADEEPWNDEEGDDDG